MRKRTRALAALIGLALAAGDASAGAPFLESVGAAPCGPPAAVPCRIPASPYPVYQGHVLPSPGYRIHVVPYAINPCAVHVWDIPHPCRRPEPILSPCSPCGGY